MIIPTTYCASWSSSSGGDEDGVDHPNPDRSSSWTTLPSTSLSGDVDDPPSLHDFKTFIEGGHHHLKDLQRDFLRSVLRGIPEELKDNFGIPKNHPLVSGRAMEDLDSFIIDDGGGPMRGGNKQWEGGGAGGDVSTTAGFDASWQGGSSSSSSAPGPPRARETGTGAAAQQNSSPLPAPGMEEAHVMGATHELGDSGAPADMDALWTACLANVEFPRFPLFPQSTVEQFVLHRFQKKGGVKPPLPIIGVDGIPSLDWPPESAEINAKVGKFLRAVVLLGGDIKPLSFGPSRPPDSSGLLHDERGLETYFLKTF